MDTRVREEESRVSRLLYDSVRELRAALDCSSDALISAYIPVHDCGRLTQCFTHKLAF